MSQTITLDQLPPEVLALLHSYGAGANGHRSPIRGPLTDLNLPATAPDWARPSFFWATRGMTPPPPYQFQEYPKLLFRLDGTRVIEALVKDAEERRAYGGDWHDAPPTVQPLSTEDRVRQELAALSEEDRAFVLEAQNRARLDRLHLLMGSLSDEQIAGLTGGVAKRGPGRPKKAE